MTRLPSYSIAADPENPDFVVVTDVDERAIRIHCEDADPEHRFTAYRLAAGWFGNLPGDHPDALRANVAPAPDPSA